MPVFAVYRRMYDYDRGPLDAKVVETVDEGDWIRELVRMNAAYAGDSLLVYLYLPKTGHKPYPAVVFFPGSNAIRDRPRESAVARTSTSSLRAGAPCSTGVQGHLSTERLAVHRRAR